LFLEPFFGGSHRDFAEGLSAHSSHTVDLLTLPARFWKWRMRGAALYFVKKISDLNRYDGMITTNLMSLSDFKALCGLYRPPALVYFHENQLTYPLSPGEVMDFQFGFTDITTALAADRVLFNSHAHFKAFFSNLPGFLEMMPEYPPKWVINDIRSKAGVLYPGCQFPGKKERCEIPDAMSPMIIWNHRWEFDKNPNLFFKALDAIVEKGLDFRLALLGERFENVPEEFIAARERFKDRIVQYEYVASKAEYQDWLRRGSILISTSRQENFGISVVEAIRYGCVPLLPDRLSYPEILPRAYHADCLYRTEKELVEKLAFLISHHRDLKQRAQELSEAMARFAWENLINEYDKELEHLVGNNPSKH
jgi:glycosyltransferase involved in cell wall biosynthesis